LRCTDNASGTIDTKSGKEGGLDARRWSKPCAHEPNEGTRHTGRRCKVGLTPTTAREFSSQFFGDDAVLHAREIGLALSIE
jgi:hypothetical protein